MKKNRKLWRACREEFLLRERNTLTDDNDDDNDDDDDDKNTKYQTKPVTTVS